MSLKNIALFNTISLLINNPSLYVAGVVGVLIGFGVGAAIGLFTGGYIWYSSQLSTINLLNIAELLKSTALLHDCLTGVLLGAAISGALIGSFTIYKIYKYKPLITILSPDNIAEILWASLNISIEMAIGMGTGAVIGSLHSPGLGSISGALIGMTLMLFTATLEKKVKK